MAGSYIAENTATPRRGSFGEGEYLRCEQPLRASELEMVCVVGHALVGVSASHLHAAGSVLKSGSWVATPVLARSTIEVCLQAWWLLDPAIEASARIQRGMAQRVLSLMNEHKTFSTDHVVYASPETPEEIFDSAEAQGFKQVLKDGKFAGFGKAVPPITHLAATLFKQGSVRGDYLYRRFSAIAHGSPHGAVRSIYLQPDGSVSWDQARKELVGTCMAACAATGSMFTRTVAHFGWNDERFAAQWQSTFDVLEGLNEGVIGL